jgi:thioredoxin domain-containing protein 5
LQPVWEEVATAMKGKTNIAKVDVTANRALGTRFDIKGFPTIKFFSQGKIYDYSGRRTKEAFIDFVNGGYKSTSGSAVPAMPTFFEQIQKSVSEPINAAYQDILKGRYATPNVFLIAMPLFVVIVLTFAILVIPDADAPAPKKSGASKGGPKKD